MLAFKPPRSTSPNSPLRLFTFSSQKLIINFLKMSDFSSPSKGSASLAFSSQRASPFRRPESPLGQSPSTVRASTSQTGSPLKQYTPQIPSEQTPASVHGTPASTRNLTSPTTDRSWIKSPPEPSNLKSPVPFALSNANRTAGLSAMSRSTAPSTSKDPFSALPPQHLHTMRESFSVLDRSNSGNITAQDVSQALADLGLDNSPAALSAYFPPGTSSLNLASYLSTLTRDFLCLDRREQVLAAFSAFDADDSGQIDVAELRDALMTRLPATDDEYGSGRVLTDAEVDAAIDGFVGRRVLKKGQINAANGGGLAGAKGKGGDVFRYGDFASSVWGGNGNSRGGEEQGVTG